MVSVLILVVIDVAIGIEIGVEIGWLTSHSIVTPSLPLSRLLSSTPRAFFSSWDVPPHSPYFISSAGSSLFPYGSGMHGDGRVRATTILCVRKGNEAVSD